MDGQLAAVSILTGLEMAHAMAQFNPSIFTIEGLVNPQGQQNTVRIGYIIAFAEGTVLAAAVSYIMKNNLPLYTAIIVGIFAAGVYEAALQGVFKQKEVF